jgi:hypothetical protein
MDNGVENLRLDGPGSDGGCDSFSFFSFALMQKKQKIKANATLRCFAMLTPSDSAALMIVYRFCSGKVRLRCLLSEVTKGAVFRLQFFITIVFLIVGRNKALVVVDYWKFMQGYIFSDECRMGLCVGAVALAVLWS